MNNWISALLNIGMNKNMLKMFRKKRNNSGIIWTSLLGLGVGAAAYGLGKNRNSNTQNTGQNVMNSIRTQTGSQMPTAAAIAEFSKELGLDKSSLTKE